VIGLRSAGISSFNCRGYLFTYRTLPGSIGIFPGQPVLCSRCADNALSVLIHSRTSMLDQGVVMLRLNIAAADLNRCELIASNSAVEKFPSPCFRIKGPGRTKFHDWNSKRPIVFTNLKDGESISISGVGVGQAEAPYTSIAMTEMRLTNRWNVYYASAKTTASWARGQARASLQLAGDKQVVDLGPLIVLDLGADYDMSTLPS